MPTIFAKIALLIGSIYLVLTAIVATELLDERPGDPDAAKRILQTRMASIKQAIMLQVKDVIDLMTPEYLTPSLANVRAVNPYAEKLILARAGQLSIYRTLLKGRGNNFQINADSEIDYLLNQLDSQNPNHAGSHQSQSHVTALSNYFEKWISLWIETAKSCVISINSEQISLGGYVDYVLAKVKENPNGSASFKPEAQLQPDMIRACDFNSALKNSDVPSRQLMDPYLPKFIVRLSGWLIASQSPKLSLIIGIVGVSLLGSISSTLIRDDTLRRSASATWSVVIRGFAAGLLVFLGVVGGLGIFGQDHPNPTPYSVFFLCFVAGVFGEDVWAWARRQQQAALRTSHLNTE